MEGWILFMVYIMVAVVFWVCSSPHGKIHG